MQLKLTNNLVLFPVENTKNNIELQKLTAKAKNLIMKSYHEPYISLSHSLYTFIRYTCKSVLQGAIKLETSVILSNRIYMTNSRQSLNRKYQTEETVKENHLLFPELKHYQREQKNKMKLLENKVIIPIETINTDTLIYQLNIANAMKYIDSLLSVCSSPPIGHSITKGLGQGNYLSLRKKRVRNS